MPVLPTPVASHWVHVLESEQAIHLDGHLLHSKLDLSP